MTLGIAKHATLSKMTLATKCCYAE